VHAVILAPGSHTRVPVLECADALRAQPKIDQVKVLPADSDDDIDAALNQAERCKACLVVAGGDGVLRAVVRAMVRRALPARSADRQATAARLPEHRTIGDLPALGLLPLDISPELPDLSRSLGLPSTPAEVAEIVAAGKVRRLDLFRSDRGGVTLHGILLGTTLTADASLPGSILRWQAHIEVEDTVLTDGSEAILACAIANADGYARLGPLPLLDVTDPANGAISIAIAIDASGEIEVRRTQGRAVSVRLKPAQLPNRPTYSEPPSVDYTDDGVDFTLRHSCNWWVEQGAWALYTER